jgi:hypothetical protein
VDDKIGLEQEKQFIKIRNTDSFREQGGDGESFDFFKKGEIVKVYRVDGEDVSLGHPFNSRESLFESLLDLRFNPFFSRFVYALPVFDPGQINPPAIIQIVF